MILLQYIHRDTNETWGGDYRNFRKPRELKKKGSI